MRIRKKEPITPPEEGQGDEPREATGEDLKYNEAKDSFELDVEMEEEDEYQHEDPYNVVAPDGADDNSTWDEANLEAGDEYQRKSSEFRSQLDKLGMDVVDEKAIRLSETDEQLAATEEDQRDDLDEEGYPIRDDAGGEGNPITDPPEIEPDGPMVPPFEDPRRDDDEAEDIPPPDLPEEDEDPFDAPERDEDLFTKGSSERGDS